MSGCWQKSPCKEISKNGKIKQWENRTSGKIGQVGKCGTGGEKGEKGKMGLVNKSH
jgi:hypothetical protein